MNKLKELFYQFVLSVILWNCLFNILDRMTDLAMEMIRERKA